VYSFEVEMEKEPAERFGDSEAWGADGAPNVT